MIFLGFELGKEIKRKGRNSVLH